MTRYHIDTYSIFLQTSVYRHFESDPLYHALYDAGSTNEQKSGNDQVVDYIDIVLYYVPQPAWLRGRWWEITYKVSVDMIIITNVAYRCIWPKNVARLTHQLVKSTEKQQTFVP